ncbi:BatA and WFA domain-containing protein [Candidatus Woesearchaeota archaeon]|nr:BatA and WFA domain-containing protein [Candidatus Woesearchaeota archaeon]
MAILELLKGVASQHLMYTAGLWALLALIPLILVYLIRPKPKKQTIPALMFLMKESAKSDRKSFLRRFIRDPLFLFQILVLVAFAIAIAKPYMTVAEDVLVEKTAIVVDASASSQLEIDGKTRFGRAIDIAKENAGSNNAVIVISSVPELIADEVDLSKARDELNHIKPRDTPTSIFDSIIFASNYVNEKDKVVVISDFIETGTQKDFNAAKSILESKGIIVQFINLRQQESRKAENIGIVDLDVKEEQVSVQIKNYNDRNETVRLEMEGVNLTTDEITIEPKAVEVVNFPTQPALSKFSIRPAQWSDDFPLDNEIYISAPAAESVPLLLIANTVSRHLSTALEVIGTVDVERGTPPKVPEVNHQIIMINNINKDLVLPGTMKSIRKKVDEGAALIVVAQPDLFSIDFEGLLPVERADNSGPVFIEHEVWVTPTYETTITEDINFGMVKKYLRVVPVNGATTLASTTNNVSMIVMKSYGKGMVAYFGMMDDHSNFKEDIYYPVFWKRLFDTAIKKQDLSELNFKTGRLVNLLVKQKIVSPFGSVNAETIMLSHQGIYRGQEKNFVANLINEEESDLNGDEPEKKLGVFEEGATKMEKVPFELTRHFLIGLLALVFMELLWIKFRGDL